MYKFKNPYWTDWTKISFLQRVILIHSYLYYKSSAPVWSDRKFDEASKQLAELQSKYTERQLRRTTQYGYAFYDFDGTTGFDLFDRLNEQDKKFVEQTAVLMYRK